MIKAKIITLSSLYSGRQYNTTSGVWSGVRFKVVYPNDQNVVDNPISVGDIIIETNGRFWEVLGSELLPKEVGKNVFSLSIRVLHEEPSPKTLPYFGNSLSGAITTPENGMLSPYWDSRFIPTTITKMAALHNTHNYSLLGNWENFKTEFNKAILD